MSAQDSVVAVYSTYTGADHAVKELQRCGVDVRKLSIVGKGHRADEHAAGCYKAGNPTKYWGRDGACRAVNWGLLFGSSFFLIPGLGQILAGRSVVAWMLAGIEGAVVMGGLCALGARLYSIRIPKDSMVKYEAALKTNQFLLFARGTAAEMARAKEIIETTDPVRCSMHSAELAKPAAA